jgi:hypothetical protein
LKPQTLHVGSATCHCVADINSILMRAAAGSLEIISFQNGRKRLLDKNHLSVCAPPWRNDTVSMREIAKRRLSRGGRWREMLRSLRCSNDLINPTYSSLARSA